MHVKSRLYQMILTLPLGAALVLAPAHPAFADREIRVPVVQCAPVEQGPTIDGDAADDAWMAARSQQFVLREVQPELHGAKLPVEVRAVYTAEHVYFLVTWPDSTKDDTHKTWVWNVETQQYEVGPDREDVVALAFPVSGPFTANMLSGDEAVWDVWQWKAARTDPAGYAMDKRHVFTRTKPPGKAKVFVTAAGHDIWIARPEDSGTSPEGKRPAPDTHAGDRVAQYVPQAPSGSAADIRAKGRWHEGRWTVEFARARDTGHPDDVNLLPLRSVQFGLAIFDREEHEDHSTSGRIELQFGPGEPGPAPQDGS